MKFTMRKLTMFLLVILAVFVLVGCKPKGPDGPVNPDGPKVEVPDVVIGKDGAAKADADADDYTKESTEIYNANLGQFYVYYSEALKETNVSKRQALMAIAEAKLLESGTFLPLSSSGGNYAISRVAPYTASSVLWGKDMERVHNVLVTDKFITAEDRTEMKAKFAAVKGTGTYYAWAKEFLTGKGYVLSDVYNMAYIEEPVTWDVLNTSSSEDSEKIVHTYDGLYEYDQENELKPALAESHTVSADGTVYTFKLREGVKWVNYQGQEVAEVVADDFVAGMQHMMDSKGGLEYLTQGVIANADEYINGVVNDFAQVGVKAVSKYEVQYTLVKPTSYFMTMLGYGVFAPMSRTYYQSQGGKFGAQYDPSAETYTYGVDSEHIAYCGPYLVQEHTASSTIKYVANPTYWNAANISIKTLTMKFNDGTDAKKAYEDAKSNVLAGAGLNAAALESAKLEKPAGQDKSYFELYGYVSATDATTFSAFINMNRAAYVNVNDGTSAKTTKNAKQQEEAKKALNNVYFRLALCLSLDRAAYNAQTTGEELKLTSLRNSYTPGTFVSLEEEVTVKINGVDTKFAKGTNYGVIVQAQLDADKMPMVAYDPKADDGAGSSDGYDGWYKPEYAVAFLEKAIKELEAQGVVVSVANPIVIDVPTFTGSSVYLNRESAFAQSVNKVLGGKVKINLVSCTTQAQWLYAGYRTSYGYEANYDIYDVSGWGPDYGDPQSYLDTMLPLYAGYMTKCIGVY